jgi:hypothetical protein
MSHITTMVSLAYPGKDYTPIYISTAIRPPPCTCSDYILSTNALSEMLMNMHGVGGGSKRKSEVAVSGSQRWRRRRKCAEKEYAFSITLFRPLPQSILHLYL